jgi:acyl-CoA thioester hydrolase
MDGFSFSKDVQVRFAETDAQGIAHHASFVVYFEVARVAYLEAYAGGYQAVRERGVEALTTEVFVRYHQAAYFDERLTVWARCNDMRGARFRYEYRITRDGELVDRVSYRPTRVPEFLATAVAKAESEAAPAE